MDDVAIKVSEVYKSFKLPHEKQSTLKGLMLNVFKRKRTFERQQVLKDINLVIKKGEFFGIVGKNGGGKSTMLKLLAGIYTPDSGAIIVNGKLTAFIELGVGFNPELTGRENIYLSGALLGFSEKEVKGMYDDIVNFAELHKFMDQKLKNYSSGMQVRLAFSIAIRAKSDVLILDEVLAVGDAAFQQKCYNYFEELKLHKQTVIFVSHDMGAVKRFCTRAAYIKGGELIYIGDTEEVADIYAKENIAEVEPVRISEKKHETELKFDMKILEQTKEKMLLEFNYHTDLNDEMYVGIAVLKDGVSIGEITTTNKMPLKLSGRLTYELNKAHFNQGAYIIGGGLFKKANRELLAVVENRCTFVIKGNDITRGAALKLEDTWAESNKDT